VCTPDAFDWSSRTRTEEESMPDVVLYGFPGSLCSQKVRLALAEKGVLYEDRFVDIELRLTNYEPWYLRLNPKGVVPTLVHGERVVTDSARILAYVDEAFEGPGLTPEDPGERERMAHWIGAQDRVGMRELSYASFKGMLGLVLRRVSMPLRVRKLRQLRGANPELADLYDSKLEDIRAWRAQIRDAKEIAQIRRELEGVLGQVEEQLGKTRHLASDAYSLADVAWTCVLARLTMLGLAPSLWGEGRLPRVEDYYGALRSRPSFTGARLWERPPDARARRELLRSAVARG
jgi:glutathione S-transferase